MPDRRGETRTFLRYLAASAFALAVDYSTYWTLVAKGALDPPAAATLGYFTGLILAYVLMVRHVFAPGWLSRRRLLEMALFGLSGAIGAAVTYLTVLSFIALAGKHLHAAKITAIGISFLVVFLIRRLLVFRPPG